MKVIFLSREKVTYSRSGFLYQNYLGQKEFHQLRGKRRNLSSQLTSIAENNKDQIAAIVVMSPNHNLVRIIRKSFKEIIILDAGWPLSDSNFTRKININSYFLAFKNLLVDLIAFHLADRILFESEAQLVRSSKKFKFDIKKGKVIYTNCSKTFNNFFVQNQKRQIDQDNYVFFRGKYNRESGLDNILNAARILEKQYKFVIATNQEICNLPQNVTLISEYLEEENILKYYQNASLVLGQLSKHKRIDYTIPHKFFEAAALGKAYLTVDAKSMRELADDSMVQYIDNVSAENIAKQINILISDKQKSIKLGSNLRKMFEKKLNSNLHSATFHNYLSEFKQL